MIGLDQKEVPTLPNDLMFLIFNELSTEDRIPLGTTCKRFREIDLNLRKKFFERIRILQLDCYQRTKLRVEVRQDVDYFTHGGNSDGNNNSDYQNKRLFRNAQTKFLNIIADVDEIPTQEFQNIYEFCAKIRIKRLIITTINLASIEQLIVLVSNQSLKEPEVFFKICSDNDIFVTIEYDTFHSIILKTTYAELKKINCTAGEIQNAFEIFRQTESYKYVVFEISEQTIDELMRSMMYVYNVDEEGFEDEDGKAMRCVFDKSSRTILFAQQIDDDENISRVAIGKTDDHDTLIRCDNVNWFGLSSLS